MSKHVTAPALAVDVRELLSRPGAHKHVVVRAPLEDLATPVASVPGDRPVTVDAEIESVVEGLLVSGTVSATAKVRCVRCLREFDQELEVEVRELFALEPGDDAWRIRRKTMPVPKRKTPRAKTRHRRSHWKSVAPTYASCPQCRQAKLPHTVCQNCGYYGGRQVVEVE
jgi:ribosomal protein L32